MSGVIETHEDRVRILSAIFELIRAVRCDRGSPCEELGVNECVDRALLSLERKRFPPYPELTSEGTQMLVRLIDTFEAHS
jgi:hypothetical protein